MRVLIWNQTTKKYVTDSLEWTAAIKDAHDFRFALEGIRTAMQMGLKAYTLVYDFREMFGHERMNITLQMLPHDPTWVTAKGRIPPPSAGTGEKHFDPVLVG